MNTVFNTQMHWLTLVFICMEVIFFFIQVYDLFRYPHRKKQWWDLFLLFLLIKFNLANGLFPDPAMAVDIKLQYMIAYGMAYLTGAYFPWYFYKMYGLESLRRWATWGVLVFTLLPYLVCDVLLYALNGALVPDRKWGVLVPGIYGLVLLVVMLRAIIRKYRDGLNKAQFFCELFVWVSILPWQVMILFAFYTPSQTLLIVMGNLGWVAVTLVKIGKSIRVSRRNYRKRHQPLIDVNAPEFVSRCQELGISERETDVARLWLQGFDRQAIADRLFISKNTVKTHIGNIYEKTGASSRDELERIISGF